MDKLTSTEIGTFLKLFNRGGYVLDFSTNDFDIFTMELIGSCCKTILDNKGVAWDKNQDMSKLTSETLSLLNLTPKSIADTDPVSENIKAVLGNLRGISTKLAEIRNPYGSGHGKSASFTGLETRHAKLAVGCSITFVTFL